MLQEIQELSQKFLKVRNQEYVRYFLKANRLESRFSIIIGQRGVGKTTAIVQHILAAYGNDILTTKALYVQADHFLVGSHSLYEIAEQFHNLGGELICFCPLSLDMVRRLHGGLGIPVETLIEPYHLKAA